MRFSLGYIISGEAFGESRNACMRGEYPAGGGIRLFDLGEKRGTNKRISEPGIGMLCFYRTMGEATFPVQELRRDNSCQGTCKSGRGNERLTFAVIEL
jgi:hypothetical protein